MIKAIIFDLGGVVFSSDGGTYEGRERLADLIGADKEEMHKLWFSKKEALLTGKIKEDEYLKEIINNLRLSIDVDELKEKIRGLNKIDEEMLSLIKDLRKKYDVAAINNEIMEWNEYRIQKFRLNDYFTAIISSCDVGVAKPEKKIYLIALKKLNVLPSETIFIDDREENLIAPRDLGMRVIEFKNREQLINELKKLNIF